jgi:membrane-associated protease RseP (regulator of RpoE activity)
MRAENTDNVNCPSCGATLVAGLRFCRMCGYRLGEGVEEYVATQRFDASSMPTAPAPPAPATDPFAARQTWGAAPIQPFGATSALSRPDEAGAPASWVKMCSPKRGGWWLWLTIAIVLLIAGGMVPLSLMARRAGRVGGPVPQSSFLGVDGFERAPGGGALIIGIAGPETPIVRAGLIGGDIIKSFDGKPVQDNEQMREILGETPVGKPVEVVYVRDGVTATTTLTTVAQKDTPGLRVFDRRPGGAGNIGISRNDLERVSVPGTNIFGAELGDIDRNGPADLAGLREGDIVIKFGDYLIRTSGDLRYRISEALPGTVVKVLVVRGSEQIEIPVKVGRSKD